jgi:hypothetical protein
MAGLPGWSHSEAIQGSWKSNAGSADPNIGIFDPIDLATGGFAVKATVLGAKAAVVGGWAAIKGLFSVATKKGFKEIGEEGEKAVSAVHYIGEKIGIVVNGQKRVPDGLIPGVVLSEVKNVAKLRDTQQIADYVDYAIRNEIRMDLYTRSDTVLSKGLQSLVDAGIISRHNIPGM